MHPAFQVDGVKLTYAQYDERTSGLFKVETTKYEMKALCNKVYCASETTDYCDCCAYKILNVNVLKTINASLKFHARGIQKAGNNLNYNQIHDVLFNGQEDKVLNKRIQIR